VAKTRAQRKAEKRAREAELQRQQQREGGAPVEGEARAQHDTQVPVSGDVAEFEAAIETQSVPPEDQAAPSSAIPGVTGETPQAAPPSAPAPSRADAPPKAKPGKPSRRERRQEAKEKKERQRQHEARQAEKAKVPAGGERRRGGVTGFIASCWAELKRVQWPDRDTLVQASSVTLFFVAVMAAYLGALDALFNFLVKRII
jgi:preprotein translocase SecE subunit